MVATDEKAAVTVQLGSVQADVQLPLERTVHETVRDLLPFLRENLKAQKREEASILDEKGSKWVLVKGINTILNATDTLDKAGVRRGDTLRLERTTAKETYAALIDDVPESLAEYQLSRFSSWSTSSSRLVTGIALPLVSLALAFAVSDYAVHTGKNFITHGVSAAVMLSIAVIGLVVAFRACKKEGDEESRELSGIGNVAAASGLIFLAAAGFSAVPTEGMSLWNVLAASIPVFVASVFLRSTTVGVEMASYAGMVSSGVFILGGGLSFFLESPATGFGAITATLASTFLIFAARMAMNAADIPRPYVPTTGEDFVDPNDEIRIDQLPTASSTEAIESIINREKQTVDAHNAILGMTSGGVIAAVLSIVIIAATMDVDNPLIPTLFIGAVVMSMLFRGKSYDDLATQAVWLIGIIASCILAPVAMAVTNNSSMYMLVLIGMIAFGFLCTVFYLMRGKTITSPPTLRAIEVLEFLTFVTIFILLAVTLDIYGMVRYR